MANGFGHVLIQVGGDGVIAGGADGPVLRRKRIQLPGEAHIVGVRSARTPTDTIMFVAELPLHVHAASAAAGRGGKS